MNIDVQLSHHLTQKIARAPAARNHVQGAELAIAEHTLTHAYFRERRPTQYDCGTIPSLSTTVTAKRDGGLLTRLDEVDEL